MRFLLYSVIVFIFGCAKDDFQGEIISSTSVNGTLVIIPEIAYYDTLSRDFIVKKTTRASVQLYYSEDSLELNIPVFESRLEPDLDTVIRFDYLLSRSYLISCQLDSVELLERTFVSASAISYSYFTFQ